MRHFAPAPPHSPLTTPFSKTAKETGVRIRNLFQWKHRRPPAFLLLTVCTAVLLCGSLVSCQRTSTSKQLTQEELAYFNQEFFNQSVPSMHNQFLTSEYESTDQVNLFELFYNGDGGAQAALSQEERDQLTELVPMAASSDVIKVTAQEMSAVLEAGMGVALEDTQQEGLDRFYYLEQQNAYYLVHGDTNYQKCTVVSGEHISDNQVRLQYTKDDGTTWVVTLAKQGDGYLFCSNIRS